MKILTKRNSDERLKCPACDELLEWENISWITTFPETSICRCNCNAATSNERIHELVRIFISSRNDIEKIKDMVINELGEEWK